jgi:hypothetical protein
LKNLKGYFSESFRNKTPQLRSFISDALLGYRSKEFDEEITSEPEEHQAAYAAEKTNPDDPSKDP